MKVLLMSLLFENIFGIFIPSPRHDMSFYSVKYLRSNIIMSHNYDTRWENVEQPMVRRVIDRYFGVEANKDHDCELFLIEGVPAAAILYRRNNKYGQPKVEEIHLNKGMLLIFNASKQMRSELYERYNNIDMSSADGFEAFDTCM